MGGRGASFAAVKASGGGIANFNKSAYGRRNGIAPNRGSNNIRLARAVNRNLRASAIRAR